MGDDKSTEDLIKDLILSNQKLLSSNESLVSSVATLKKDVTALKTRDKQPEKRPRVDEDEEEASRDGDGQDNRDSDIEAEDEPPGGTLRRFTISEEGEAFLETVFGSRLEYATRKAKLAKLAKYGQPDSKWTMCPELSPVVAATLSKEAIKNDKVAFCTQLWMEATGPLTACLEKAHDGELTVQDAVPMIQAALLLMGDAAQNHAALRRKAVLQNLNPQLQPLMKESDFKGAQPYLLGENFAEQAKSKLEAAAALKKSVYPSFKGKSVFRGGHPRKNWGRQGGRANNYGPGRSKKEPAAASQKRLQND